MTTTTHSRRYGIEIEFTGISQEAAVEALNAAAIPTQLQAYNHTTANVWKVITDASCGLEAVSPILQGNEGLAQIEKVCRALSDAGAKVTAQCGLHVHMDVSDFEMRHTRNLVKLWVKFEDVFDTFQPASRRSSANRYCQSNLQMFGGAENGANHAQSCETAFKAIDGCVTMEDLGRLFPDRYLKLNIQAYFRHRTLEVRHHCGTLCGQKATHWVCLLLEFYATAKAAKQVHPRPANDELGQTRHKWFFQRTAPKALREFYTKRAKHLARAA